MIEKVYGVYDTVDKKWWQSPKGKMSWRKPGHAKNAVNANPPETLQNGIRHQTQWYTSYNYLLFSEQDRYEVREFIHMSPDVVERLAKLDALEAAGVDNWEGYDDAMSML